MYQTQLKSDYMKRLLSQCYCMNLSAGVSVKKTKGKLFIFSSGADLAQEDTPCNEERQDKEYRHKTDFATEGKYG